MDSSSAVDHATPFATQSHWAASVATTAPSSARSTSTGATRQAAAASARPKSAAVLSRKLQLTTNSNSSNQREDASNTSDNSVRAKTQQREAGASSSARVLKATFSSSRVGMHHEDQFCAKFKSPRPLLGPRPPSASSALVSSSSSARSNRFRGTDAHISSSGGHTSDESRPVSGSTSSRDVRVGVISQRVMKEEIETQRRVTRQVQRQFHALQHALAEKLKDIELVRRHLSTFEAQTSLMTASSLASPLQHSGGCTTTPATSSSATVAVLTAGAQSGGSGARHRESIAAAAGLNESPVALISTVKRLKDQVQRQELYKKKLKHLLERLSRHVQFLQANLEALRIKQASTKRELQFFQTKLLQERNHCTELEHKRHELIELQVTHAHNAMLVLDSLREEIASRSMMSRNRYEADRRREELLALVHSSPATRSGSLHTASTDREAIGTSPNRKNSLHVLSADKSPNAVVSTATPTGSRHWSNSVDLQQFVHRETFMQIYEGQYARVLEETGESDLSVVIERFVSFKETKRHLLQIESDVAEQNVQLEREREAHNDLVRKLRVSGIAEVEKRKKIRDFLEQMHHVKAQVKSQARDKFVEQLKTFSYVQQGVGNIVELFKCLDGRPQASSTPSASALTSPLAAGSSPVTVMHSLEEMVLFCVQVARINPNGAPIVFTTEQVDKLRMFVSDHLKPDFHKRQSRLLSSIESSLGAWKSPPSPVKAESLTTQGVLSTLLKVKRRRSSMEDALGHKSSLNQSPAIPKSGDRAHATSRILSDARGLRAGRKDSATQQLSSCRTNDDGRTDTEEIEDNDALVSSESDSEDVRRDIKRGEKDTLQQVEALLRTFDAKQSMSSSNSAEHQSAATKLRHQRSAGRHGSLHLMPAAEGGNLSLGTVSDTPQQQLQMTSEAKAVVDTSARLDAVYAFFREKRRRERQEQQQQREVLALLAEASYNTKIVSSISHMEVSTRGQATGTNSATSGGQGNKVSGPVRSRVATSMITRKRSNGTAALALNSVIQQQQQQQVHAQSSTSQSSQPEQQQVRGSAVVPRKPMRPPKTVR